MSLFGKKTDPKRSADGRFAGSYKRGLTSPSAGVPAAPAVAPAFDTPAAAATTSLLPDTAAAPQRWIDHRAARTSVSGVALSRFPQAEWMSVRAIRHDDGDVEIVPVSLHGAGPGIDPLWRADTDTSPSASLFRNILESHTDALDLDALAPFGEDLYAMSLTK